MESSNVQSAPPEEGRFFCFPQIRMVRIIQPYKTQKFAKTLLTTGPLTYYYDLTRNVCNVYNDTT